MQLDRVVVHPLDRVPQMDRGRRMTAVPLWVNDRLNVERGDAVQGTITQCGIQIFLQIPQLVFRFLPGLYNLLVVEADTELLYSDNSSGDILETQNRLAILEPLGTS
jgi:hypothetical protein